MGQGLRRASWSEGGGCGGAAGFSFGERPGSNGGSAGRWLLPLPGNGPGTGGVFLGRRGRAAAGRRASFSGRGRLGQKFPRGSGCYLAPKTAGCQRCVAWLEGTGRGEVAGFSFGERTGPDTSPVVSAIRPAIRCYRPLLPLAATARRLSPAACRFSPLVITTCRPLLPPVACLPAAYRLPLPVIISSSAVACTSAASRPPHQLPASPPPVSPPPAISAAMRRPGGQMGCGGTPRGRSGRDASPARSSAK